MATALRKSKISCKFDSWFVCPRVMSSNFLISPFQLQHKSHKRGDFPQIESYGPNTVGHKSNGIPLWEWESSTTYRPPNPSKAPPRGTCAFAPLPLELVAAPPPLERRVCHHHGQGGDDEGWQHDAQIPTMHKSVIYIERGKLIVQLVPNLSSSAN